MPIPEEIVSAKLGEIVALQMVVSQAMQEFDKALMMLQSNLTVLTPQQKDGIRQNLQGFVQRIKQQAAAL